MAQRECGFLFHSPACAWASVGWVQPFHPPPTLLSSLSARVPTHATATLFTPQTVPVHSSLCCGDAPILVVGGQTRRRWGCREYIASSRARAVFKVGENSSQTAQSSPLDNQRREPLDHCRSWRTSAHHEVEEGRWGALTCGAARRLHSCNATVL